MTDTVFIQDGKAQEIFAGRTLKEMETRRHPDMLKAMVEVKDGEVELGDIWDGRQFANPVIPPEEPRPRDPLAELDALKTELRSKGVIDATIRVLR
jgi:hypothetical protein